jgi:DNA-directed RNA polymerase specialized sigma24 family protein
MEFAEYVARQRPALMRFATVLTCRTWLAEDLVSDVLGRAFEQWDRRQRLPVVAQAARPPGTTG